ncbi:MAG: EAL domain-containing protein [Halofilum sp. (in: g-proteobacteria)]
MNSGSTIRLLVVSEQPEDAEHVASQMRTAGYSVKPTRVEDGHALGEAVGKLEFDVALHVLATEDVELNDTIAALRERNLYVPVIAYGEGDLTTGRALAAGAGDRVVQDSEHLRYAIIREFERTSTRRRAHHLEAAYRESEERARALMQSSRDAIAYIHDGMHVLANDAYLARFGYEAFEDLEGTPIVDMVSSDDREKLKGFLRDYSRSEEAVGTLDLQLQQAGGKSFQAEMEFSRASIDGEACSQIIIREQTNTAELERQLTLLSQRDSVTGLYNRQYFVTTLQEALTAAGDDQAKWTLAQITIDGFDQIKEQVGVIGSDQVIADVARILGEATAENDVLARLDGATYGLLTPGAEPEAIETLAGHIRQRVRDHICNVDKASLNVTACLGLARIDGSVSDPNAIMARSERALADARRNGPDAHHLYQPKAGELSQKEIDQQWTERIRDMLQGNQFSLLYQPIVSLAGDSTARYEVLLRTLDEHGQPTDDPEFRAAAERTGMAKGVDRWTVFNALKALLEELRRSPDTVFFVPLSASAFDDAGLFRWIHERIKSVKLPQGRLVFQIDGPAAATRIKQAAAFSAAAHKIGCEVSLSGFGHGSDPFHLTQHIAVDYLRISEDFTRDLASNEQNQESVRKIAVEARSHGKQSICPGVEDASTLTVLWTLGTDMIEGSFLQEATHERSYDFASMAM